MRSQVNKQDLTASDVEGLGGPYAVDALEGLVISWAFH